MERSQKEDSEFDLMEIRILASALQDLISSFTFYESQGEMLGYTHIKEVPHQNP